MRCCQRITRTHPAEQSSLCLALTLHLYVPIIVCGKHQLTEVCHKISWPEPVTQLQVLGLLQHFKPKTVQSSKLDLSNIRNFEYINYLTYIYYIIGSSVIHLQSTAYILTSYRVNWVQRQLLCSDLVSNTRVNNFGGQGQLTYEPEIQCF